MTSKLPKRKMRTASAERTTPAGYFPKARTALGITLVLLAAAVLFCGAGAATVHDCGDAATLATLFSTTAVDGDTIKLTDSFTMNGQIYIDKNLTLDLNGKTLTAASNTRLFYVNSGYTFSLKDSGTGGKLTGGSVSGLNQGGGVYVYGGTFEMSGGSITYCNAGVSTHEGSGGGVYVDDNGTFTMTGGSISNCTGGYSGGGVFLKKGTFTMTGGSITSCDTLNYGGGVCISTDCIFQMSGGSISGCKVTGASGKGGGVYNGGTFKISGKALVAADNDVYLIPDTKPITLAGAFETGNYGVLSITHPDVVIEDTIIVNKDPSVTADVLKASAKYFKLSYSSLGLKLNSTEDALVIIIGPEAEITETGLAYKPVAEAFTAAEAGQTIKLRKDAALTDNYITIDKNLTFDLNGKTLTAAPDKRLFLVSSGTFTLKDSATGGKLTGGNSLTTGGAVEVNSGCTFIMESGSITGCRAEIGGGVYNSGTFTMSGGNITNCEALGIGGTNGGAVYVYGTFTMSGDAEINKCNATNGGGVYASYGVFTMAGGSITGCNATQNGGGASIFGDSDCFISGAAEITGNTAQGNAENLYLSNDDLLHLAGAFTGSIGVTVRDKTPIAFQKFGTFDSGSGAEKFFADGAEFTGTISGTDLVWGGNAVTVTFNENGGEGLMDDQTIEIDVPTKLNKNTFKRTGYTFDGWATSEEGAVVYADEEEVTLTEDLDLYAHWTVIKPKPSASSGGSQDTGSGNYSEYPRTADGNGGVVSFGTSRYVKAVELPAGVKGEVILKTKTSEKGPEGAETLLVFEINIRNYPEGTPAGITYEFPLGEIEKTGHTPADYILMHKDSDTQWTELPTTYEVTGTKAVYTAVTTAFSPFAVVYAEGGAKPVDEVIAVVEQTAVPTAVVTAAPTAAPTAVKTEAPTAVPTKAAKSPAALGGLAAGLAAAGLLFGRRE